MSNKPIDSDQIIIDFRTSCSKDEAAAKLLGWLRGPIYPKYIKFTSGKKKDTQASGSISDQSSSDSLPDRIEENQLKSLYSLDCTLGGSLESQLMELYEVARLEFSDAMVEPDLENKANTVLYWERQICQAASYLRDIDDELETGEESVLKLDKKASKKAGSPQILLNSLDRWAKKKYKFSIFGDITDGEAPKIIEEGEVFSEDGSLKKVYADNLFTTMAFLIEAFSKTMPVYHSEHGPVVIAIARKIEALAKEACGGADSLPGQKQGAIKLRIGEAMRRKKKVLNEL